jgi:type VI secretion system protein ImpK
MKLTHWKAILRANRQVNGLLDTELGPEPAPDAPRERLSPEALEALARRLTSEVEGLRAALSTDLRSEEVEESLQPFVYLVDERVLRRLDDADAPHWPLLQLRMSGVDSGGDLFFELADSSLRRPDTPALLFEMLHFCLTAGFTGRNVGHPARIRDYRERLAVRIPQPELRAAPPPVASGGTLPTAYDFPWRYYALSVLVILALPVLLWRLSN